MHGPPASYTGDLYKAVDWAQVVPILDTISTSLGLNKRRRWRRLRREALAKWERAGFTFAVAEEPAASYPAYDPSLPSEYDRMMGPMVPGALRLMKLPDPLPGHVHGSMYAHPGAWAAFHIPSLFMTTAYRRQYVVAHEIGHCFGLAHRQNVEETVMWLGLEPDAHDIEALRTYYSV